MKFPLLFAAVYLLLVCTCDVQAQQNRFAGPNGDVSAEVALDTTGAPAYFVRFDGIPVMEWSPLGLRMDDADFTRNLRLDSSSGTTLVRDSYKLQSGKKRDCAYLANRKVFYFSTKEGKRLDIIFQISNDGVAFRYFIPGTSESVKHILSEKTGFDFKFGTHTWIQPMSEAKSGWNRVNPAYEEHYQQDVHIEDLPQSRPGWVFPALFKYGKYWIALSETAPNRNYCGCRLMHDSSTSEFTIGFPPDVESFPGGPVKPESKLPWTTPWRIMVVTDNPATLTASTLGTDLADPCRLTDISYVKPGRSSWSWVLLKDDSTVFSVQKRFIDYAADMGWEYCLVDADWDRKIGYEKLGELCSYAALKGVGITAWYNSAGDWNTTPYTPRDKLLTKELRDAEFSKLKKLGVRAIKVDFFGADGQSMMAYYQNIIEDAARYGLMVDCHGSTLPRGWERTYPNLVTMESIKGMEYVTFDQSNADRQPTHCTVLPFTRNLFDPMDFTPVCFSEVPNIKRKTTNSFELALSVLFLSGIQHYAEIPEGMARVPAEVRQIMKDVPVVWDESRYLSGYPGNDVVIARRRGSVWYIAGINGEAKEKTIVVDARFITNPKSTLLVSCGDTNRTFRIQKENINLAEKINIPIGPNDGFLMQVKSR